MTVLVAYDGSDPAYDAVEYALTEHSDEDIVLLRVVELAGGATGAGIELAREKLRERRKEAESKTAKDLEDLIESSASNVTLETVIGEPERVLIDYATEHEVDHIVVGSHGREGFTRVLLGSVAESVVRRAPCPVTVVR